MTETEKTLGGNLPDQKDQTPEVYAVDKDLSGWRFSRRGFLAAAGATATAATLAGCDGFDDIARDLASGGGEIEVLDPDARVQSWRSVKAHEETVNELAWSPDGSLLVSISGDETVKVWSMPDGAMSKKLSHHDASVSALAISPDGTKIVTGDWDGEIRVWELPKGKLVETLTDYWPEGNRDKGVTGLAYTPDGKHFVSGHNSNTVMVWDAENPRSAGAVKLDGHTHWVMDVAVSPDGTRLASADLDGKVRLWSLPGGDAAGVRSVENGDFEAVTISPDGSLLVAAGRDKLVHLWSLAGQQPLAALEQQKAAVKALAFTPDGMLLIAGSGDFAYLYASDGSLAAKLDGGGGDIKCLAVSPDGTLLAAGDSVGGIKIWSLPGGELVSALIDLKINKEDTEGIRLRVTGADGKKVTYTLPCGAPVPAGAVCTCNCVGGSVPNCSCVGHSSSSGGGSHYWHPC